MVAAHKTRETSAACPGGNCHQDKPAAKAAPGSATNQKMERLKREGATVIDQSTKKAEDLLKRVQQLPDSASKQARDSLRREADQILSEALKKSNEILGKIGQPLIDDPRTAKPKPRTPARPG